MEAIRTKFRNRIYRSRLEARWAAFFHLLDWKYEYEPYDMRGWIPDFIIANNTSCGLLVEIKPTLTRDGFDFDKMSNAIKHTPKETEILLLGCSILSMDNFSPSVAQIGWLYGECEDDALLNFHNDRYGVVGNYMSWKDRISGFYDGNTGYRPSEFEEAEELWNEAGNMVQWRR
jgi:hypothetical protein